jgi:mersacidin/lichenicidin family type 2 lantibiotic
MNPELIIRAWKDPEFRARLASEQLHTLPAHPSGSPMTELGDDELAGVAGGLRDSNTTVTITITITVVTR